MQKRAWMSKGLVPLLCWVLIGFLMTACGGSKPSIPAALTQLEVVPVPTEIAKLDTFLSDYTPQVKILSPQPDELITQKSVTAQFSVTGYPLFKDAQLGLGPHLHVILDNQPYVALYNAEDPVVFEDLSIGSHTLRVFAGRPWHESFKNAEAYAQISFHVLAKTPEYIPQPDLPLLTYNRPLGTYGAQPILVDFWLANAPLRESLLTNVPKDWRIRYTLNGKVGLLDQWQPFYLQGFRPGQNIFLLELVDGSGNPIRNSLNSAAREITFTPGGQDTLSRLVRGELKAEEALGIVKPLAVPPTPAASPLPPTPNSIESPSLAPNEPVEDVIPGGVTLPIETDPGVVIPSPVVAATVEPKPTRTPRAKPSARPKPSPKPIRSLESQPTSEPVPEPTLTLIPIPSDLTSPEDPSESSLPLIPIPGAIQPEPQPETTLQPSPPASIQPDPTPTATPKPTRTAKPTLKPTPKATPKPIRTAKPTLKPTDRPTLPATPNPISPEPTPLETLPSSEVRPTLRATPTRPPRIPRPRPTRTARPTRSPSLPPAPTPSSQPEPSPEITPQPVPSPVLSKRPTRTPGSLRFKLGLRLAPPGLAEQTP